MAVLKFTWLINWQERAGFTEAFYKTIGGTIVPAQIETLARGWATKRAACLTVDARILSCRVSDVLNPRRVQIVNIGLQGTAGIGILLDVFHPDVVNVCQFITFNSAGESPRYYHQRGLPDGDVVDGKVTFAENGRAIYNRFWNFMVTNDWEMRDFTKSNMKTVASIDGVSKEATLTNAAGFAEGDLILIQTRQAGNGLKRSWQGKISYINGVILGLKGYRFGDCSGGQVWKLTATYPVLSSFALPEPNWARTRQTGRPFGLPRGRAPKKT